MKGRDFWREDISHERNMDPGNGKWGVTVDEANQEDSLSSCTEGF